MDTLAALTDLDDRLANGIPAGKEARAETLLRDASATIRAYTGQQLTAGTTTDQYVRPKNGVVRLPQRPVTAITAVTDLNDNDVTYTWNGDDRLTASGNVPDNWSFEPWRNGIQAVKVTYTHGYDEIPEDIIAVVCQIAGRALGVSPEDSGHSQESIAGYSYSIGTVGGAGPLGMLPDERAVLDLYRLPRMSSIRVGF